MTNPNNNFELSIEDIDLIESCLIQRVDKLSPALLKNSKEAASEIKQIQELLGKIHHQKIWFRPKKETYISG